MSVGHTRAAIRSMLRLPARGRPWPLGLWLAAVAIPIGLVARLVGRLWTWLVLSVVVGLALGAVPLFGVLGFELAIAMSVFAAVMGLDVGSALARELQRMPVTGIERAAYAGTTLARSTLAASALAAGIVLIPAGISAVRGLWLPTCDWWFGIEAYALLPVTTAVLAGALGHAIGVVAGPRRFLGAALAQVPLLVVAVLALLRFYGAPPVFTYNAVLGYFPGNLYDENVQLEAPLLWSRLEQLLFVAGCVALVAARLDVPRFRVVRAPRPIGTRTRPLLLAIACLGGSIALHTQAGRLGYAIDVEDIEDALGGRIETPHFIIHYAKTDEIEKVIGLVAADHEFRYAQVTATLGVQASRKIRSFYFADRDQKARWMGARDVEMAKPWRHEIYLDHRAFPHGSLRHEIAHAVAAEFGDPWFGVAARHVAGVPVYISPGLIEGLAVAVDWPGSYDRLTPHEAVRALQEMGLKPSIGSLLTLQFFTVSSATGYTTAGSFLRFLLDRYGAAPLRTLYGSGGDFAGAYGKPLAKLEGEWLAMIANIQLPAGTVEATRERFRGGSVFQRPCPHAIAKRREQATDALAAGDRPRAVQLLRQVCGDAPEEPRHRLMLGALLNDGEPLERAEASLLWTRIAYDAEGVTSSLRAEAFDQLVKVAAARQDVTAVRALVARARALQLDPNERRQLDAYALALDHAGPAGAALRGYFFGSGFVARAPTWALLATLAEPTLGFAHYLLGLQYLNNGEFVAASESLAKSLELGLPGQAFVRNAARRLLVTGFRTNDRRRVELAITVLSGGEMTASDRLLATDWNDRLAFDAR